MSRIDNAISCITMAESMVSSEYREFYLSKANTYVLIAIAEELQKLNQRLTDLDKEYDEFAFLEKDNNE